MGDAHGLLPTSATVFQCTDLASAKIALKSFASAHHDGDKPTFWETWGVGLAMVSVTAFAAMIGILFVPMLGKKTYNRALTFMNGLGVGALSGTTMYVMLPQAFHIEEYGSGTDYVIKAWLICIGIYMLFMIDKILKFAFVVRVNKKNRVAAAQGLPPTHGQLAVKLHAEHEKEKLEEKLEEEEDGGSHMLLFSNLVINSIDGLAMGLAFADSLIRGVSVGVAIAVQQFPQEISDLAVLMDLGIPLKKTLLINLIPGALSFICFAIGVILYGYSAHVDDSIFAVAAGMYFYICLATLIPEMSEKVMDAMKDDVKEGVFYAVLQIIGILCGLVFIFFMSLWSGDIVIA